MSKVLVVATSHLTRGGITSVVKAHASGQQWSQYNCRWIETHIDRNIFMKIWWVIRAFFQFVFLLPGANFVHIHASEPPSIIRKSLFFAWAKLWRKPVIIHFHAFSPETTINGSWEWLYRKIFSHATRVIVLSKFWKDIIEKKCPRANTVIMYNPCLSAEDVSEHLSKVCRQPIILFAGTVNQRKGYVDMIRAFATIAFKYPEWRIVFAGNGEIDQGLALARELHIEGQTLFLGWVNGAEKDKVFRQASIFCLPSYAEGFPMSVLDAWSYGLPAITTPVGGIPDIAVDGENALLFNAGDLSALSSCMERLMKDETLRQYLSAHALQLAHTTFNKAEINRQLGSLYAELLMS